MEGIRVLEVAQWTFVPSAGAVLIDWGAEVIKVEHAVTGDALRGIQSMGLTTVDDHVPFSPIWEHANHGKRSIGLALEHPEALEVLYEIARSCDVFLTNFLPEARRRLKIDVDDIRAVNPDIVYVRGARTARRVPRLSSADTTTARTGRAVVRRWASRRPEQTGSATCRAPRSATRPAA